MTKSKQTFDTTIKQFEYKYDLRTVFDDFLTMSICAMGQNPRTGKSHDEELYLETVAKYKEDSLVKKFPEMFAYVVSEMTERMESSEGYDVIGEFYERNLCRKSASQFFTPWPICVFMAQATADQAKEAKKDDPDRALRILDPTCGSGRMLLTSRKLNGVRHEYYGIDIDHTCVKMTALNLFLSGLFHSEALCADALLPKDFCVSYQSSLLPFGLFRVQEKEQSGLWHILRDTREREPPSEPKKEYGGETARYPDGSQLRMF